MKGNKAGQDGIQVKRSAVRERRPEPELEAPKGTTTQCKQGVIRIKINAFTVDRDVVEMNTHVLTSL